MEWKGDPYAKFSIFFLFAQCNIQAILHLVLKFHGPILIIGRFSSPFYAILGRLSHLTKAKRERME